jgi:hypothetical protein
VWDGKLLASFQNGAKISDVRVFRWSVSPDGNVVAYIDNRGERDIKLPPTHDFEWVRTGRENTVHGRHPHVNILDAVFVETIGGDLTVKLENNTEDGLGVYREDVLDKTQSLDDAQIEYARVGRLILMKILPYRETIRRYLIYNTLTRDVRRLDAIGQSCIQLPEDHGLIFPGGYYLQNGECKTFDQPMEGMLLRRMRKSPNGEDVLYVFYEPVAGRLALFNYNLIERALSAPIVGHGYTIMEDGRMLLFEDQSEEAARVHPMQIWATPFYTPEYADRQKRRNTILARVGNADLVRGVSDLYNLARETRAERVSSSLYAKLSQDARRLFDDYFWMKDEENFKVAGLLREIAKTAELVIDEYEKVESIRSQSARNLREAASAQKDLFSTLIPDGWDNIREFSEALERIHRHRGRLISLRAMRYMDLAEADKLETALKEREDEVARGAAAFMTAEKALAPFNSALTVLEQQTAEAAGVYALAAPGDGLEKMAGELEVLSALMSAVPFEDAGRQTAVIEKISGLFARVNQARARLGARRRELGEAENAARFGASFKLFGQAVASALSSATDPERCDEELSRLLLQLEELESRFSGQENFLNDILQKRDELLETFEGHKRALVDERQRRARSLSNSAARILETLSRRAARFVSVEEVNAFFAADPMSRKVRELAERLRELKDSVRADDIEARFKAAQDQALRGLRDKTELYEDGGASIRLGPRHRFSVNAQPLDLTLMLHDGRLWLTLTGTDFQEPADDPALEEMRDYWDILIESESREVSRAEFLAYRIISAARRGEEGLTEAGLAALSAQPEAMEKAVRAFAAPRYREGYEKGLHDHDAALILRALLPLNEGAGLLRFSASARALAMLFWQSVSHEPRAAAWPETARASLGVSRLYQHDEAMTSLTAELENALASFIRDSQLDFPPDQLSPAAEFLALTLAGQPVEFVCGQYARSLYQQLRGQMEDRRLWLSYANAQREHDDRLAWRWKVMTGWLKALAAQPQYAVMAPYVAEAAALAIAENRGELNIHFSAADLSVVVTGLLSAHPRIVEGRLELSLDDFFTRLRRHDALVVPGFNRYQERRRVFLARERERLRLDEFKPRPLTSFVRNRLIDQVYLPIIGDNLAKQIGASGQSRRSDLMGLLMLISPPGYGKTTLMEYTAYCLGLIFMKINGPALGRQVISLDPEQAPDAASRQELRKLNLALEMGNNVMLYVDDIQHTNPEFLQKFISLCDGGRRIEGVWNGRAKTYDLRGKKFCVVMAGNPYTESGEVFKIPDMLANRADVYNLGEVLGGMEEAFALSYIENCLTSNQALAPLAQRDMNDLYHFIDRAMGRPAGSGNLAYNYSEVEENEIVAVLARLIALSETVMAVNRAYIASAAQSDKYRAEPPFRLQGSYRNMNKLAQQVSAVMNEAELAGLVDDLYAGEAQLLTGEAEENLLKLAEIRGRMTPEEAARWAEIKRQYMRRKTFGGDEAGAGDRVAAQLADLVHYVKTSGEERAGESSKLADHLGGLAAAVKAMGEAGARGVERQVARLADVLQGLSGQRTVVKVADLVQSVHGGRQAAAPVAGPVAAPVRPPQPQPNRPPQTPHNRPLQPARPQSGPGSRPGVSSPQTRPAGREVRLGTAAGPEQKRPRPASDE